MSPVQKPEAIPGLSNRGIKIHGIVYMRDRGLNESVRHNEANHKLVTAGSMSRP